MMHAEIGALEYSACCFHLLHLEVLFLLILFSYCQQDVATSVGCEAFMPQGKRVTFAFFFLFCLLKHSKIQF